MVHFDNISVGVIEQNVEDESTYQLCFDTIFGFHFISGHWKAVDCCILPIFSKSRICLVFVAQKTEKKPTFKKQIY